MKEIIEKWHNDKKYRAKIKLLLYGIFIILVTIYAVTLNNSSSRENLNKEENSEHQANTTIIIPEKYHYNIEINNNDKLYHYSGDKMLDQTTIIKEVDNVISEYIVQNDEYYVKDNDLYVKTNKEVVYDVVNYNYINLETINSYLTKAERNSNQYTIYLRDVILGNDTNEYFIVLINGNKINIDYTPLMKQFDSEITKYEVNIEIEEIE